VLLVGLKSPANSLIVQEHFAQVCKLNRLIVSLVFDYNLPKTFDFVQKVREAKGTLDSLRDAALMANALERRTQSRTIIVDDIITKWINSLQASWLDLPRDPATSLSDHLNTIFSWLHNVLDTNRYFVEQWKVFPPDWKVRRPRPRWPPSRRHHCTFREGTSKFKITRPL
jgi:hypothetical protein